MVQVDAADGFSHPAYEAGEAALVAAAQAQGIAMMGITNAYACGVLGYFTARLARQGLVALMFANASSTMAPWGGRKPFFGTNPWSMAAPRTGDPLIIDSSSSATAYVNLATAAAAGRPIPPHWALDAEGHPDHRCRGGTGRNHRARRRSQGRRTGPDGRGDGGRPDRGAVLASGLIAWG